MEIIPNVHLVPGLRGANVYLLLGRTLTLVDTGMPGSADRILSYVDGLHLAARDLARIVLTHHHLDHMGSVAAVKQRTSAQVFGHPGDAAFISGELPPPPARGAMLRALFRLLAPVLPPVEPVAVDVMIHDGDRLDLLNGATVLHLPGHTPGAIALHFPLERLLICGDAISHRANRLGPPGKPFTVDMNQAVASLRRLAGLEYEVLCPGHGAPIVGGADEQVGAMVRALA